MSRILIKTAWGSDDPTKAAFAFSHANALAGAGHEVQIFLLGEAVSVMKSALAATVHPVGWPVLSEIMEQTFSLGVPLHVCTNCSVARSVLDADLEGKNAKFVGPPELVALVEWADKILTE